jgi:predicted RNA binding protein YcfA (HicA-like mRNA interferase family)
MTRLPRLKGKEVIRVLGRNGFRVIRNKGSDSFLKHADGRAMVVPVHAGETIRPGLLRAILRDVEMSVDDLLKLG